MDWRLSSTGDFHNIHINKTCCAWAYVYLPSCRIQEKSFVHTVIKPDFKFMNILGMDNFISGMFLISVLLSVCKSVFFGILISVFFNFFSHYFKTL